MESYSLGLPSKICARSDGFYWKDPLSTFFKKVKKYWKDPPHRERAVQEMIWSIAVQYGGKWGIKLIKEAVSGVDVAKMTD